MSTDSAAAEPIRIAFVCVRNAGRSQMAAAFAERERAERGLDGRVEILTGGTRPDDRVHEGVLDAMSAAEFDLSDRTPRAIDPDDLLECDHVVAMGCDASGMCPATWSGDARDWDLADPHGRDPDAVRAIRDDVERRVADLFDELFGAPASDGP